MNASLHYMSLGKGSSVWLLSSVLFGICSVHSSVSLHVKDINVYIYIYIGIYIYKYIYIGM